MLLPDDNVIPLGDDDAGALVVDETEPPVPWDHDALLGYLPAYLQGDAAAVRDAIVEAYAAMARLAWAASSRLLDAQQSPRNADDVWLMEHGRELHRAQAPGETEAQFRARLLRGSGGCSPVAIQEAANAILRETAPLAEVAFIEPYTDAVFYADDADPKWSSFYQPTDKRLRAWNIGDGGKYAGIYYIDGPPPGSPPTAFGPSFWLALPIAEDTTDGVVFFHDEADGPADYSASDFYDAGFYGTGDPSILYRIASEVEAMRLGGVPWFGFLDSLLSKAV